MRRAIRVEGETWKVFPSGRVTFYAQDEYGIVFQKGSGPDRVRRVTRYSPIGARRPDKALSELSDHRLTELFRHSQPAWTSPETEYAKKTD